MRRGLLLVNLGTPEAPETRAVRRYLREFLSDPRVIDMNPVGRFLLLNLIILPFRPAKSAAAYRKIWTERGSPLLFHGRDLTTAVAELLGDEWHVELAMRYGRPSLTTAFDNLRDADVAKIVVLPLYPQYASSTVGSTLAAVFDEAGRRVNVPTLSVVGPFYRNDDYVDALADNTRELIEAHTPDHVLISFHGLPESHVLAGDDTGRHCLAEESCCDEIGAANRNCYRAQCFATAASLADRLGLDPDSHSVAFQSRLGRSKWIGPYTEDTLLRLAQGGVKRLLVVCPAFVADCLETLEEIAIRGKEVFVDAGGEDLWLVPALNSTPKWAAAVARMASPRIGKP